MWQQLKQCGQLHEGDRVRKLTHEGNKEHSTEYIVKNNGGTFLTLLSVIKDGFGISEVNQNIEEYFDPTIAEKRLEFWAEEK